MEAELFQLTSERLWKNSEAYFLEAANELERWDPLVIGHDIDHTGLRTNLLHFRRPAAGSARPGASRSTILVRPSDELLRRPNPAGLTFDESDVVDPSNFLPGVLTDITTAPFLPDNCRTSAMGRFGEAQFNLATASPSSARCAWTITTPVVRLGRAGIDQQVDDLTGRMGLVFDLSDDTALYGQYGTGSHTRADSS